MQSNSAAVASNTATQSQVINVQRVSGAGAWQDVTPDMALQWLKHNTGNRRMAEATVTFYARQMSEGMWRANPQPILIDSAGEVIDGQHRLEAVVKSGRTLKFYVIEGCLPSVKEVVDTGRSRSAGDLLTMTYGLTGEANGYAAAAKTLMIWDRRPTAPFSSWRSTAGENRLANVEIAAAFEAWKQWLGPAMKRSRRVKSAGIPGGLGFWAAILARFGRLDDEATSRFVDELIEGANLLPDSPILQIRNRFMAMRQSRYALRSLDDQAAIVIRAWNAWRQGRSMKKLAAPRDTEQFPVPV